MNEWSDGWREGWMDGGKREGGMNKWMGKERDQWKSGRMEE